MGRYTGPLDSRRMHDGRLHGHSPLASPPATHEGTASQSHEDGDQRSTVSVAGSDHGPYIPLAAVEQFARAFSMFVGAGSVAPDSGQHSDRAHLALGHEPEQVDAPDLPHEPEQPQIVSQPEQIDTPDLPEDIQKLLQDLDNNGLKVKGCKPIDTGQMGPSSMPPLGGTPEAADEQSDSPKANDQSTSTSTAGSDSADEGPSSSIDKDTSRDDKKTDGATRLNRIKEIITPKSARSRAVGGLALVLALGFGGANVNDNLGGLLEGTPVGFLVMDGNNHSQGSTTGEVESLDKTLESLAKKVVDINSLPMTLTEQAPEGGVPELTQAVDLSIIPSDGQQLTLANVLTLKIKNPLLKLMFEYGNQKKLKEFISYNEEENVYEVNLQAVDFKPALFAKGTKDDGSAIAAGDEIALKAAETLGLESINWGVVTGSVYDTQGYSDIGAVISTEFPEPISAQNVEDTLANEEGAIASRMLVYAVEQLLKDPVVYADIITLVKARVLDDLRNVLPSDAEIRFSDIDDALLSKWTSSTTAGLSDANKPLESTNITGPVNNYKAPAEIK